VSLSLLSLLQLFAGFRHRLRTTYRKLKLYLQSYISTDINTRIHTTSFFIVKVCCVCATLRAILWTQPFNVYVVVFVYESFTYCLDSALSLTLTTLA